MQETTGNLDGSPHGAKQGMLATVRIVLKNTACSHSNGVETANHHWLLQGEQQDRASQVTCLQFGLEAF